MHRDTGLAIVTLIKSLFTLFDGLTLLLQVCSCSRGKWPIECLFRTHTAPQSHPRQKPPPSFTHDLPPIPFYTKIIWMMLPLVLYDPSAAGMSVVGNPKVVFLDPAIRQCYSFRRDRFAFSLELLHRCCSSSVRSGSFSIDCEVPIAYQVASR